MTLYTCTHKERTMGLFIDAINNKEVTYDNGATEIDTSYNLGDGYHKVKISGSKTNLSVGNGDTVIKHYGDNCSINAGEGWKKITSLGNNKNITTDTGDDDVIFIGDNITLDTKGGNDKLAFWGNNCDIKMGDGDDSVTTYDQLYTKPQYSHLANDFIDRLETGTWEKWTLKSSDVIDVQKKKSFCSAKTTTFYEQHYDVETIFSRYINGVENTTIDMGDGKDTANVTLGQGSSIKSTTTNGIDDDIIIQNEKWQIDESLGHRDEVKIVSSTKKSSGWKAITELVVGALLLVGSVIVGTFCIPAAVSIASAGYGMVGDGFRRGNKGD